MAQTTEKWATSVHGTNPQNLIEYITRQKIYDSLYWKQYCFGLSAEALIDRAVEVKFVGGMFGEPQKPTEFICLVLKLLQIQPEKEIILEYIRNDEFKYLRVLGAFYFRLVGRPVEVYHSLEPLLNDYRRIRLRRSDGSFELTYIDEIVDEMLTRDSLFSISLPRLPERAVLESTGQLPGPRVSSMQAEFDAKVEEFEQQARESLSGMYEFTATKKRREKWKLSPERKKRHSSIREDGEIPGGGGTTTAAEKEKDTKSTTRQDKDSMSVAETNALRASLGLPPLK